MPMNTNQEISPATAETVAGQVPPALAGAPLRQAIRRELARLPNGAAGADELVKDMDEWKLAAQGRASEADILHAYAAASGIPAVDEEQFQNLERFHEVTYDYLSQALAIPLHWDDQSVTLAVATPYDTGGRALEWLASFRRRAAFVLARRSVIEHHLTRLYDTSLTGKERDLVVDMNASEQALRDLAGEAPIVRLVNDLFSQAVENGASDIHVEPAEDTLAVRYRIDGILQTAATPPLTLYPAIASRLKLLAGMNIAERRLPQDGRIDLRMPRAQLDVRVSTIPSMHGESIVLRLLQKDTEELTLDNVGLEEDLRRQFEHLVRQPYGMILVVGPTGSGKTTTLYSALRLLNSETRKIITIEDPVEYQLQGLTQVQVRPQIGLTFADGLRSIVRQDPDVILVGEIRDLETAEIAVHAALTGHLVLTTLHTNDAAGAISRLQEMGVESFLLSSSVLGVLSQRLVRRLCPECAGSGQARGAAEQAAGGRRCRNCAGRGYKGRIGIFELLQVNDEIRKAINEKQDSTRIAALARRHGMVSLQENGARKVQAGLTSPAEVSRVCQLDAVE